MMKKCQNIIWCSQSSSNQIKQTQSKHKTQEDNYKSSEEEFSIQAQIQMVHQRKQVLKDTKKKKNKHAPSESSSKRPVSRIRDIPGLPSRKQQTLHTDIRFDAAYGKLIWPRQEKIMPFR